MRGPVLASKYPTVTHKLQRLSVYPGWQVVQVISSSQTVHLLMAVEQREQVKGLVFDM